MLRAVTVTKQDFEQTIQVDGDVTRVTGTDDTTGERVKFKMLDSGLVNAMIAIANRQGEITLAVADHRIIAVEPAPEPVSGEWDSPGTSPEDDDDR